MKPVRALVALVLVLIFIFSFANGPAARAQQAAAAPAPAASRVEVPYAQFNLPNGLHVILHEDHTVPLLTVMGSGHVKYGVFDRLLESAGGTNNASTAADRTNYYIDVPSNALDLALYLESDRMGYLLDAMSPQTVNAQRDVVKNERRENYENAPYGMASIEIAQMLYPEGHPYRWPTIGYMEDLTAASYEDVLEFFRKYYQPANASLVVAGDINTAEARAKVEKWFADVKPGSGPVPPIDYPHPMVSAVTRKTIQDRVQLPRLYLDWITPAHFQPGDAELDVVSSLLAGGKNSRLYKRLVYELQIAQDVAAYQASQDLSSQFEILVTARPPKKGETATAAIDRIRGIVDEELRTLQQTAPASREFQRAINQIESSFYDRMERIGGFGGVGDQMNGYYTETGNPAYFNSDLARYRALGPADVTAAAAKLLPLDKRVELVVEPAKESAK
ncbi:MAG: insulinase family protein [Acidobacteria bacterium]|nr:MAG: insulinase family protein [Acidobacteriota bacterium]